MKYSVETEGFGRIKEETEIISDDSAAAPESGKLKFLGKSGVIKKNRLTLKPQQIMQDELLLKIRQNKSKTKFYRPGNIK